MSDQTPRPELLEELLARHTRTGRDAMRPGEMFERPSCALRVPADHAGALGEDCELTLRELSYADEVAAAESGKQMAIGYEMAKRSVWKLNGVELSSLQRETVWAALGSRGRQLITGAYAARFTADASLLGDLLGKA